MLGRYMPTPFRYNSRKLQEEYGFENPFLVDPLVKRALRYCRGKRVLDVGCGEGADSVAFAQRGYDVTAFDNNPVYLKRFRSFVRDQKIPNITILKRDATRFRYPRETFDVISCILVICCMKRSAFEIMIEPLKESVAPGGVVIMSARNYLDPEFREYRKTGKPVEPNTFRRKEDCCQFMYFVEKGRLLDVFKDFVVLYHYEGYAPCKYGEHPRHGDTYIICRRKG
jgi:SAM-dependent methyltransferase